MKCLYGKQEGAVIGYNPKKPGRPSHSYHSALMANNETAPLPNMPGMWAFNRRQDGLTVTQAPGVRGTKSPPAHS